MTAWSSSGGQNNVCSAIKVRSIQAISIKEFY